MRAPLHHLSSIPFLLALCTAAAAQGALEGLTPIPDRPEAPGFDLKDPDGRTQRLTDHQGQPVILNFWATWCPPCRKEMPSIERAHEEIADEGIAVMAINVGEDAETIKRFLEDQPVGFALPMDLDMELVQRYPVKGLPTTFVIAPDGRLVYVATGEREWDDPAILDQVRALKRKE